VRRAGHTPLVLAGDSAAAPGMAAGALAERLLWLGEPGPGLAALRGEAYDGLVRNPLPEAAVCTGGGFLDWLEHTSGPLAVHVDLASGQDIAASLRAARATGQLAALSVVGYDPVADPDGTGLTSALETLRAGLQ